MQTAVVWLFNKLSTCTSEEMVRNINNWFEQAKQMEKEQIKEELIGFQIYLNDEGYIENHDWDFEKEAIVYSYKNK